MWPSFGRWYGHSQRFIRLYSNMQVKVPVKQGVVVGQLNQLPSGLQYESFLGVPYAQPPVGELRFRSPVPLERFSDHELDCSKERDVAHQRDPITQQVVGSENCLFLNIYAPKVKNKNPLPVMVWIHGGGFCFGNGNSDYHFPAQLMQEEVIVVTLNYRLGALGFLSLPGAGIYGNAGLKDQRLALQWIQDNIVNFNGDPQNVTLFGESAGASSIHLHIYAAHANELFHKAIMQSGTANMEWVMQQKGAHKARRLGELLKGQNMEQDSAVLEFLQSRNVTPNGILANTLKVLTPDERRREMPFVFKPVVENADSPDSFVSSQILDLLLDKQRLQGMPVIMGYNSAEGLAMIVNARRKLDLYEKDLARLVPRNLIEKSQAPEAQEAANNMRQFYFNGQPLSLESLDNLVDLFTDYHFIIDMQLAAEIHVNCQITSPLYFYRFDYLGGRNMFKKLFQAENLRGTAHAEELFYLFQMAGEETPQNKEDTQLSKSICRMWANFAKYGKPSDSWMPVTRPKSNNKGESEPFHLDYMLIDRECRMQRNPDAERMDFWRSMYKRYKADCYEALRAKL
ncbi:acetylcholinesterase-like isoform X2 [Drosophila innubila]|uniref:acetylcholinesterase-like isoform X2 n=1 Tax=Drosophila innubila TaxID=198719 RepID=UPI00148C4017|nr:acetylcholinesterase-like isoform X2 [Drosophila innubila]